MQNTLSVLGDAQGHEKGKNLVFGEDVKLWQGIYLIWEYGTCEQNAIASLACVGDN